MYPLQLLSKTTGIVPLFDDQLIGEPHVFDFSPENPETAVWDTAHFDAFQAAIVGELKMAGKSWGIGRYLEERSALLRNYPQILEEGRVFHAGLDITALPGSALFAPIPAVVFRIGKEEGTGNYGGFVVLCHPSTEARPLGAASEGEGCPERAQRVEWAYSAQGQARGLAPAYLDEMGSAAFYSFYGHLRTPHMVREGDRLDAGRQFAAIGGGADSGGWFTHTHLQVITQEAMGAGRMMQGYVTAEDLKRIESIFPSPYPLFRY